MAIPKLDWRIDRQTDVFHNLFLPRVSMPSNYLSDVDELRRGWIEKRMNWEKDELRLGWIEKRMNWDEYELRRGWLEMRMNWEEDELRRGWIEKRMNWD